jgi:hypothetical protein
MQNCVFNRGCEGQKGRWLGDEPNELNFLIYEENIFFFFQCSEQSRLDLPTFGHLHMSYYYDKVSLLSR